MAGADAELAAAAGDVEEAAPLVPGSGARRAPASATATGAPRDVHLLSSAFLFVFLAYHAAQNLQSTVNTDENLGDISLGVLHGVLGGGLHRGAVDGVQARPHDRHLRLPPLHRRQPRTLLVVQDSMPRTNNEIKNCWRTHMRKKAQERKRNMSPSSSSSSLTYQSGCPGTPPTTGVEGQELQGGAVAASQAS